MQPAYWSGWEPVQCVASCLSRHSLTQTQTDADFVLWNIAALSSCTRLTYFAILATLEVPPIAIPTSIPSLETSHVRLVSHFVVNLPDGCERISFYIRLGESATSDQLLALLQRMDWEVMSARLQRMHNLKSVACRTIVPAYSAAQLVAAVVPSIVHHAFSFFPCSLGTFVVKHYWRMLMTKVKCLKIIVKLFCQDFPLCHSSRTPAMHGVARRSSPIHT